MSIRDLFDKYEEEQPEVTCNRCQRSGFVWRETDRGWRLFDEEQEHFCGENIPRHDLSKNALDSLRRKVQACQKSK